MNARLWICGRKQFVRAAVAIDAGRRRAVAALHRATVEASVVRSLFVRVAGCTSDFLRDRFVRRAFYIRMAVDAGEHAAMNGVFESLRIHVQADRLAVLLMRQRSVAVAGEAFVRRGFGRFFLGTSLKGARR